MKKIFFAVLLLSFFFDCLGQKVINRAVAFDGTVYEIYDNGTYKVVVPKLTDAVASKATCKPTTWGVAINTNGETKSFNIEGDCEKGYTLRGAYYACTKEKELDIISYQGFVIGKASGSFDTYTIIANHYTYFVFGK